MLTGRLGCSRPQAIEQGRKDFKVYMSKLLEQSAVLDTFRSDAQESKGEGDALAESPAWSLAADAPDESFAPQSAEKAPPVETPDESRMAGYFGDKGLWPRAGVMTPPRSRIPPNFSWKQGSLSIIGRGECLEDGEDSPEGENFDAAADRAHEASGLSAAATLHQDTEDGSGDGWKATWARRFARGPFQSEYQDRFLWPPDSVPDEVSSGPTYGRRTILTQCNDQQAGSHLRASPTRQVFYGGGTPRIRSRSQEDLRRGRRDEVETTEAGESMRAARRVVLRHPEQVASARTAMPRPDPWAALDTKPVESPVRRPESLGERHEEGQRAGLSDNNPASRYIHRASETGGTRQLRSSERWDRPDELGFPEVEQRSGFALGSRLAEAGSSVHAGTTSRWLDDEGDLGWRRHAGLSQHENEKKGREGMEQKEEEEEEEDGAEGYDHWRNGESSFAAPWDSERRARGQERSNIPQQSLLTEYREEFTWPSDLPQPGRRGRRSGMGMDHVARLLAGKTAEEPRRRPDPEPLARLGHAVDQALAAGTARDLMELCRMRSPAPTAKRLVYALVVALGLRWKRWSDIRVQVLASATELQALLERFDKDRAGLTSCDIRPFAEDQNLSPGQVKQVAVSMMWISRWILALYDYLLVKEGRRSAPPSHALDPASLSSARRGRDRGRVNRPAPNGSSRVRPSRSLSSARRGRPVEALQPKPREGSRGFDTKAADGCLEGSFREVGRESRGETHEASWQAFKTGRSVEAKPGLGPDRNGRRQGPAAAMSNGEDRETGPAAEYAVREADLEVVDARRRGDGERANIGNHIAASLVLGPGSTPGRRSRRQGSRGGRGDWPAEVSFAESKSDLSSESIWTTGTVSSRGEILDAPTEDYIDLMGGEDIDAYVAEKRESGRDTRRSPGTSSRSRSKSRSAYQWTENSRPLEATRSRRVKESRDDAGITGSEDSRGRNRSYALKGPTPSRYANPKARQVVHPRHDPILAHCRWPPQPKILARDRTEQRSAFSLGQSFLAPGLGPAAGIGLGQA